MTQLAKRFAARIAATGPITLAEYMTECLLDPEHGYYATRDPFGAKGDFTTAPEISQKKPVTRPPIITPAIMKSLIRLLRVLLFVPGGICSHSVYFIRINLTFWIT